MKRQNWLPTIFNDLFDEEWPVTKMNRRSTPAINIVENRQNYCVEVAAPGLCKKDFKVEVNADNELVISLEKHEHKEDQNPEKEHEEGTYLRREFSYSSFQQRFSLPDDVDKSRISAKAEHGVLHIVLPKREEQKSVPSSQQIDIE